MSARRHGSASARRCAALVAGALLGVVACGGDDGGDGDERPLPLIGDIAPAIEAVESELGGPQSFFEVNATPQLVNLFVATDGGRQVVPYVYLDGELQDPAPAGEVTAGTPFPGDDVEVADDVFDRPLDELDSPIITQFVVVSTESGAPRYEALVASERGGRLVVGLGPDGEILSVDPL